MEEKECVDVVHKTPLVAPVLPQSRVPAYIDPTNVASKDDLNNAVAEIKNNPDVVDIVATKADIDAYDKSQLTDKDIVKVLKDETQGGGVGYYRYSVETTNFTLIGTLYKATQETLSSDKGTAVIANDPTGGLLKFTTNDGKQSGIAVNDGEQDIYAQLYSKTTEDNNGARISLNPTGAYYTKGDSIAFTDNDEIVTKKQLDELNTLYGDNGTALIQNESDGGFLMFKNNDGNKSAVAVNDGTGNVRVELYSVTEENNTGSRFIMNENGAYYTKADSMAFTDNDEIVTKKALNETLKSLQTKVDELSKQVSGLIEPKTLTKDNINNTPGTFIFTGNSDGEGTFPKEGCDWAGIQLAAGKDAYQIIGSNGLWIRVNDGGVTAETTKESWGQWIQINTTPELQ